MQAGDLAAREAMFRGFGRAWFKADMDLLYQVVTPDFTWAGVDAAGQPRRLQGREAVAAELAAMRARAEARFSDVAYHHLPELTVMTFRMRETPRDGGPARDFEGVELYRFRDGLVCLKDVFRKAA